MRTTALILACSLARGPCGHVRSPEPQPARVLDVDAPDATFSATVEVGVPFDVEVPVTTVGEGPVREVAVHDLGLGVVLTVSEEGDRVALHLAGVVHAPGSYALLVEHPDRSSECGPRGRDVGTVVLEVEGADTDTGG